VNDEIKVWCYRNDINHPLGGLFNSLMIDTFARQMEKYMAAKIDWQIENFVDPFTDEVDSDRDSKVENGNATRSRLSILSRPTFIKYIAEKSPFARVTGLVSDQSQEINPFESGLSFDNESFTFGVDIPKAIRNNAIFAREISWSIFTEEILNLLGYRQSLTEETFAKAVARWQSERGFPKADGIIGPATWSKMFSEIIMSSNFDEINIPRAILLNSKPQIRTLWQKDISTIHKVLGFYESTPSPEMFAKATALWQRKLGFRNKDVDGILGEQSWKKIQPLVSQNNIEEGQTFEEAVNFTGLIRPVKGINLYAKPNLSSKLTDKVYHQNMEVVVTAIYTINREWIKIRMNDGNVGWVPEYYVLVEIPNVTLLGLTKAKHIVKENEDLDTLVKYYYPNYEIDLGNDRRTIIHAFSILNEGNPAVYYEGESDSWWRDKVLDRDMAETRRIYSSIRLRANRIILFPNEIYIQELRRLGVVGVRPKWKNEVIRIGEQIVGFLKGVAQGFIEAGIDTIKDLWDFLKAIVTGKILEQAYDLINEFRKYSLDSALSKVWSLIKEIVGQKFDEIVRELDSKNPFKQYQSIGRIIGNILFEVVVFIVTSGTSLVSKISKSGKLANLMEKSIRLTRIAERIKPAVKATMAGYSRVEVFYDMISAGSALFSSIDAIEDITFGGFEIAGQGLTKEIVYENHPGLHFSYELSQKTGNDAESYIEKLLRGGDPDFIKAGMPPVDQIIYGQYNASRHGIDMFAFSVHGGKVKIFIIEVKGGLYPKVGSTRFGIQMSDDWIENAIDNGLQNRALRDKLEEAMKFYFKVTGKVSNQDLRKFLLEAERRIILPKSMKSSIKLIKKRLKSIGYVSHGLPMKRGLIFKEVA
jgi:hypothetical protein